MKLLQQHKTHIILTFILLFAAFLRLYKIGDYLTFLGDEGRDVLVVYNILHGHLTLLGPTSSVGGFFLGPIYYYFMAPFLWLFNYSPVGPAVMIALFGVVTVWSVYFIGSKIFNPTAGIIAALLYAISPLVIAYSRSSWNPNLMPITTLVLLYVLYLGVKKSKLWYFLLCGFLFGIAMQLHYIEVFVGATLVLYMLFTRVILPDKISMSKRLLQLVKEYASVLVGFLVGFSPFLAFEARHGFENTKNILTFIFHSKDAGAGAGFSFDIFTIFFRIFARLIVNIPTPDAFAQFLPWQLAVWSIASWIVGISSFVFLAWLCFKEKQRGKVLQYLLLLFWLGFGILFFGFYRKNIYDYYFEFLFPVPFLLVGGSSAFLLTKNIWLKVLTIVSLVALVIINLQGIPFRYAPNKQLQQTENIARFVLDKTNNQPYNFALITGGNSDHAYRYFFTVWGHPPVTIQYPGVDPKRTTVTNQLLVVCESLPCYPLGNSLWEIAGFGQAQIVGEWNVSVVKVYKLEHYQPVINK